MEVNSSNFLGMLPQILQEAENARFVAIDTEMSGIAFGSGDLTSIPDAYSNVKDAAEDYQILQVGFTFISYVPETSEYTTRTFNCYVSPLLPNGSFSDTLARHLDREFSVSARSYDFLRNHGFNFSQALNDGVSYLSREEQRIAKELCSSNNSRANHIDPSTLDEQSQKFYSLTRAQIGDYVHARSSGLHPATIAIRNPHGNRLNGLQIRLIHQITEEEYPTYVAKKITSGPMAGSMSIALVTRAAETEATYQQHKNVNKTMKLSGLQIVFEALSGGSFAHRIDPGWALPNGRVLKDENFDFHRCEANLKEKRPIIIGHHIFQDLAFIYQAFFEPLPLKVDDFLAAIHQLFPRIIDTKFMHVRGRHLMEREKSLNELGRYFARGFIPPVRHLIGPEGTAARPHNAAYDSMVTASVFIKQTSHLFSSDAHLLEVKQTVYRPGGREDPGHRETHPAGSATSPPTEHPKTPSNLLDEEESEIIGSLDKSWVVLKPDTLSPAITPALSPTLTPPETEEPTEETDELTEEETDEPMEEEMLGDESEQHDLVPRWSDAFWRVYGNKTLMPGAGFVSFV
ncbi:CAF1-domain-containing protein [Hypoxylon sp. FL1284]|nr:CAF1-domain-containing protein [Hypoxylon sp. FL1284]